MRKSYFIKQALKELYKIPFIELARKKAWLLTYGSIRRKRITLTFMVLLLVLAIFVMMPNIPISFLT